MGRKGKKFYRVAGYIVETNRGKIILEADEKEKIKNEKNLEFIKLLFDNRATLKKHIKTHKKNVKTTESEQKNNLNNQNEPTFNCDSFDDEFMLFTKYNESEDENDAYAIGDMPYN